MIYKISEIFPSIQGEGLHLGRLASFVRLAGCNLKCPNCDTRYSWETERAMTEQEISKECKIPLVIITGGEPFTQSLKELVRELAETNHEVHIETNGTIWQYLPLVRHFIVSPKLPSMCDHGIDEGVIKEFRDGYKDIEFKFVIGSTKDYYIMHQLVTRLNLNPVVLQPLDNMTSYVKYMIDLAIKNEHWDYRIMPQFHKTLWGNKRGV